MRQAKQIEAGSSRRSAPASTRALVADRGRAAGALAGVAPTGPADLTHHRRQLPRRHRPLHPPNLGRSRSRSSSTVRAEPSTGGKCHLWTPSIRPRCGTPGPAPTNGRPACSRLAAVSTRPRGPRRPVGRPQAGRGMGLDRPQPGQAGHRTIGQMADVHAARRLEDAARLLRSRRREDPELGLFLRLAVVLGARRGELCGLAGQISTWTGRGPDRRRRGPRPQAGPGPQGHQDPRQAPGGHRCRHGRAARVPSGRPGQGRTGLRGNAGRRTPMCSPSPRRHHAIDPDGVTHRFQQLAPGSA